MTAKNAIFLLSAVLSAVQLSACDYIGQDSSVETEGSPAFENVTSPSLKESEAESVSITLNDIDGTGENYEFFCSGRLFRAEYTPDNWKIVDSYLITDHDTMTAVCEALAEIHPIHGADMESLRTVEDMVFEWEQHNLAYRLLPDDSPFKKNAADVDIDPKDQGKDLLDFCEDRLR